MKRLQDQRGKYSLLKSCTLTIVLPLQCGPIAMNAKALDKELLKVSLSPIAPWLDDPAVTDILVYGSQHVYVRRNGTAFERVQASWSSDADLMTAAKTIGRHMARRLEQREPILDARLRDKNRLCVVNTGSAPWQSV